MATEKQIQANRLNAPKGGPKTAKGRSAVRLNALSHGFFSQDLLLPGEDPASLTALCDQYLAELEPVGELETLLVERILSSAWRLKRLIRSERIQFHVGTYKPQDSEETVRMVDYRYSNLDGPLRYETALERQIYKALHELERLQIIRQGISVSDPQPQAEILTPDSAQRSSPDCFYPLDKL